MRITRAERYEQIRPLREDEGLMWKEIGDRLGVSLKTANDIYCDPTGEKADKRRAKNNGACVDCGAETRNGGARIAPDRCRACAEEDTRSLPRRQAASLKARGRNKWSDEQILSALRLVARDGLVTTTAYLDATTTAPGLLPSLPIIIKRFGRWNEAARRAGLRTSSVDKHRARMSDEQLLEAIRACADVCGRHPTYRDYGNFAQAHDAPSGQTIRNRLGPWMEAVELALTSDQIAA